MCYNITYYFKQEGYFTKFRRLIAPIIALVLSGCAVQSPYISLGMFAAAKEKQTTATVSFNEGTRTLTLKGKVVAEEVQKYNKNGNVKTIIAEEGTVSPKRCDNLFSWSHALKIDLSKADTSKVTYMHQMFSHFFS